MKFPAFLGPKSPATADMDVSPTTTAVPSRTSSPPHLEKEAALRPSNSPSIDDPASTPSGTGTDEKTVEITPVEEAEALDKLSDEVEYPTGSKLAIITLALCLSVFLVALVRTSQALRC